jgi:hypothetical protein
VAIGPTLIWLSNWKTVLIGCLSCFLPQMMTIATCHSKYDFVFEFDSSSGHARRQPDGLSVATDRMNVGFVGQ